MIYKEHLYAFFSIHPPKKQNYVSPPPKALYKTTSADNNWTFTCTPACSILILMDKPVGIDLLI